MRQDERAWVPDDWVPVERRWFGFDRRTVPASLAVLVVVAIANLVLPGIDAATPLKDEIAPGEVLTMGGTSVESDKAITVVPPVGWDLESGAREEAPPAGPLPGSATVVDGARSVTVTLGTFDGDATDLLEQVDDTGAALDPAGPHVVGEPAPLATDDGTPGVLAAYEGGGSSGVIACFVIDGTGVEVLALGPADGADLGDSEEVLGMIRSIRLEERKTP